MNQEKFAQAFVNALSDVNVIRKLREALIEPLNFEIKNLQDSNNKIISDIKKLQEVNVQLHKEVDRWKTIATKSETKVNDLEKQVCDLEEKLDQQEQYSRGNSLRIKGLPTLPNENLVDRVKHLAERRLDIELDDMDIDKVHRIKAGQQGSDILIRFTTYRAKNLMFKARTKLRRPATIRVGTRNDIEPEVSTMNDMFREEENAERDRMYTSDLTRRDIFFNEDLTRKRSGLLYRARQFKKEKRINDCWSYDGRILVKDKDNTVHPISNFANLQNVCS